MSVAIIWGRDGAQRHKGAEAQRVLLRTYRASRYTLCALLQVRVTGVRSGAAAHNGRCWCCAWWDRLAGCQSRDHHSEAPLTALNRDFFWSLRFIDRRQNRTLERSEENRGPENIKKTKQHPVGDTPQKHIHTSQNVDVITTTSSRRRYITSSRSIHHIHIDPSIIILNITVVEQRPPAKVPRE